MPLVRRGTPKGLKINRSHPAAKGCMMLATIGNPGAASSAHCYDLISRQRSTNVGTISGGVCAFLGPTCAISSNSATATFVNRPTTNPSVFTFAMLVKTNSTLAAATLISNSNTNPVSGLTLGISSGGAFNFFFEAAGGTVLTSTLALAVSTVYFVCAGWNGVNSFLIVRNLSAGGTTTVTTGTVAPSAATALSTWGVGATAGSAICNFSLAYFGFNGLSVTEAIRWSRDPWAIFQRDRDTPHLASARAGGGGGSNKGQFLLHLNLGN